MNILRLILYIVGLGIKRVPNVTWQDSKPYMFVDSIVEFDLVVDVVVVVIFAAVNQETRNIYFLK